MQCNFLIFSLLFFAKAMLIYGLFYFLPNQCRFLILAEAMPVSDSGWTNVHFLFSLKQCPFWFLMSNASFWYSMKPCPFLVMAEAVPFFSQLSYVDCWLSLRICPFLIFAEAMPIFGSYKQGQSLVLAEAVFFPDSCRSHVQLLVLLNLCYL